MFRRQHVPVAVLVLCAAAVLGAGCSDNTTATPRVTFTSLIQPGPNSATLCPENTPWLMIGSFGNPADPTMPVNPINDGAPFGQGTVTVDCSVVTSGNGFAVRATTNLTGAMGGAFTLQGQVTLTGDQPNEMITTSYNGETYTQQNCIIQYNTSDETVAAGRIWADFDCTMATDSTLMRTCETKGSFRFENCGQ